MTARDRFGHLARRRLHDLAALARDRMLQAAVPASSEPRLAPTTALQENGFAVFRGLFRPAECARFAQALKSEAGIQDSVKYTKVDAANAFPTARDLLFEGRIVDAVRSALGGQPRFLQVSDLHYLHDTAAWHRDSVHRGQDASATADWSDRTTRFGVVKAILYLESENAAMGILAGSHLSPLEMDHSRVKAAEDAGEQLVIGPRAEPNARLLAPQKRTPLAWQAHVGDVLVFDERMYHAGRRVDNGKVSANREAPKFTLSLVFGLDNHHSERMYSYFRFVRRELHYRELDATLASQLAARDLVLTSGWRNFYQGRAGELEHVYLPDRARLPGLISEFSEPDGQPGAAPRADAFI